jgi:transforming growth factor-beta-induced protein
MKKNIFYLIFLWVIFSGIYACTPKDKDIEPEIYSQTVMEYLRGDMRYSTLVSAIDRAGIADAFSRPLSAAAVEGTPGDSITLLAPDNTAFSLAGITDVNAVDANTLRNILLYHVPVAGRSFAIGTATAGFPGRNIFGNWVSLTTPTTNGAYLRMRNLASVAETPTVPVNNTNRIFISGSNINGMIRVNFPNIFCNNGIVHGVDRLLMPPSLTNTLYDVISANPNYSRFKYAVDKQLALVTALKDAQLTRTLFIPTNSAFDNAGITEAFIDANTIAVNTTINYHIMGSRAFSNDIRSGTPIATTGFGIIPATSGNDVILNNNPTSRIVGVSNRAGKIDQLAINGVIHEINAVLTPIASPTQSVEQQLAANANLNLFAQALVASGLSLTNVSIGTISAPNPPTAFNGPYTAFIPVNQAFIDAGYDQARLIAIAGLPAGNADKVALANILRYHVLPNRIFSLSASNGAQNTLLWNGVAFLATAGTGAPNGTPNQTNSPAVQNYRQLTLSVSGGVFSVRGATNADAQVIDATLRNQVAITPNTPTPTPSVFSVYHVIPKLLTF